MLSPSPRAATSYSSTTTTSCIRERSRAHRPVDRGHPEADLLYSDEDKIDDFGRRFMPTSSPAGRPDLLLSNAYMCHVLVAAASDLVSQLGGCRSEFDGAQDYDLMLRIAEMTNAIVHVPEVLYHWRTSAGSASGDPGAKPWASRPGAAPSKTRPARRRIDASVVQHPRVPGSYHFVRRHQSDHLVSAIIPFRDEPALTAACYRSFIEHPGYDNFELLLVDNDSAQPETRALLEDLARDHRVRLIEAPGPFDWVAINNEAARKARGEMLLFLNNDVVARSHGWLAAMVAQAERPEVGAVGARLLYPDGTVQHAGVVVGVDARVDPRPAGNQRRDKPRLPVTHDRDAQLLGRHRSLPPDVHARRSRRWGVSMASLPIAFNDIDYCLRLREAGLLVVYTPLAEMIHHESKSRGPQRRPQRGAVLPQALAYGHARQGTRTTTGTWAVSTTVAGSRLREMRRDGRHSSRCSATRRRAEVVTARGRRRSTEGLGAVGILRRHPAPAEPSAGATERASSAGCTRTGTCEASSRRPRQAESAALPAVPSIGRSCPCCGRTSIGCRTSPASTSGPSTPSPERVDEDAPAQLRLMEAVRADLSTLPTMSTSG